MKSIIFLKEHEIQDLVKGLADQINHDYRSEEGPLVLICPLKGSIFFFSDFVRQLSVPCLVDFISIESHQKDFIISKDVQTVLKNRNVLIVKEVIDSARKLLFLKKRVKASEARSVKVATLIDKPSQREQDFQPDYFGIRSDDRYFFGYGMDNDEKHRHLRDLFLFAQ